MVSRRPEDSEKYAVSELEKKAEKNSSTAMTLISIISKAAST